VYEFTHSHRLKEWRVLESASVSYGKATPYFPVLDLLKRYVHIEDSDDLRTIRAKVTGQVLTLDESLQEVIPALLAGRLDEAHTLAERTLAHAREYQERSHQAYALRLLGDIAAQREPREYEPAETHYRQALVLAKELGMRPLQAHCHRGLGTLYAKLGRSEQARPALSAAIELYRAMEMQFWLPQAEAALAQVK
jgi:tetratricopeptide (TPR) repeat protein